MLINEKIRLARQAKGWTQEEAAEKLKMSVNGYGDIERGETDLKLSRLMQISKLFEVRVFDLMNAEASPADSKINRHENKQYLKNMLHKIDVLKLTIEQKDKEIDYLKEIIELLKKRETA